MTVPLEPVQRPALLPSARGSRAQAADPRLRPLMRGFAYRPDPSAPLWQQALSASLARCEGAWHSTPTATALCGLSAALVLGLWVGPTEPDVHLLMPARPGRSCLTLPAVSFTDPRSGHQLPGRADVRLRKHNRGLEPRQLSVCDGLTVTSLLRTALNCAFDEPARVSLPVLDSAVRALVKPDRFSPQASAHTWKTVRRQLVEGVAAQGARRGARRARLVARLASPLSESYGESVLRWQVAALGLPAPVEQQRVEVGGRTYFLDLGWPWLRAGAEYDGTGKYGQVRAAWEEKTRQDRIRQQAGVELYRFTSRHLADPGLLRHDVLEIFPPEVVSRARPVALLGG